MSYLAFCTFDLKGASSQDYVNAYGDLAVIGLARVHVGDDGTHVVIPTTSAMGSFDGANALVVRDEVIERIQRAFAARRFTSEIFLTVGGQEWGWAARAT